MPLRAVAETMLAVLEAMAGRFDDARERWQSSMRRLEDVGLSVTVAILQMYRVFVELLAGTPERAAPSVTEAYAVLERTGERRRLATTAALLGRLLYAQGSFEESDRYSRIAEEGASRDDVVTQVLWRGTRAKLLARGGEHGRRRRAGLQRGLDGRRDRLPDAPRRRPVRPRRGARRRRSGRSRRRPTSSRRSRCTSARATPSPRTAAGRSLAAITAAATRG